MHRSWDLKRKKMGFPMTGEELAALCWLIGEGAAGKCEEWRNGWNSKKTADAAKLAKSCYAEGFVEAAVRAYRRVHEKRL